MKEKLFWIIITAFLVVTLIVSAVQEQPMAIDFEASSYPQYVSFGQLDQLKGLTQKTVCAWAKIESTSTYQNLFGINSPTTSPTIATGGYYLNISNGKVRFVSDWSGGQAGWDSVTTISAGAESFACVSYDNSSTANNAAIYINGASSSVTEIATPSGSVIDFSPTTGHTKIGLGIYSGQPEDQFDGIVRKILVYNRILTAAEIADMYNSRGASYPRNGLVFCPMLYGAKGLSSFDGALAAANTIYDPCSNTYGVPNGSPVAVPETVISVR